MLDLKQIIQSYPQKIQAFKKNILREYLQYKILQIIFDGKYASKLAFLGETSLRIIYNNNRFSEDLDFDNFGLTKNDFSGISAEVKKGLELEGYEVEIRNVFKGAFRCYVKIPKLLYENDLSQMKEEKILIQLDTAAHGFKYKPDRKILNKFDVFTEINVTPLDILLSQKIVTAFDRKRHKGRDFYDIVHILSMGINPNYKYLKEKVNIHEIKNLKKYILEKSKKLDFKKLAKDVEPFLFSPKDSKKVKIFEEYIRQSLK